MPNNLLWQDIPFLQCSFITLRNKNLYILLLVFSCPGSLFLLLLYLLPLDFTDIICQFKNFPCSIFFFSQILTWLLCRTCSVILSLSIWVSSSYWTCYLLLVSSILHVSLFYSLFWFINCLFRTLSWVFLHSSNNIGANTSDTSFDDLLVYSFFFLEDEWHFG